MNVGWCKVVAITFWKLLEWIGCSWILIFGDRLVFICFVKAVDWCVMIVFCFNVIFSLDYSWSCIVGASFNSMMIVSLYGDSLVTL
jgi:hypothetical protein